MRFGRPFDSGPARGVQGPRRSHSPARLLGALVLCAGLLAAVAPRDASAVAIALDTSSLAGSAGRFEFLLLDLDGVANNTVTVSNLTTNGTPIGIDCSVGCTGGPPFVLDDTAGLGQFLYDLTLGSVFRFDLTFTSNFGGIGGVDPPDRFALSLLDPGTNFTLVNTDLTFPPAALLTIDLINGGLLQLAAVTDPRLGIAVPEPGGLALTVLGLVVLAWRSRTAAP